MATLTQSTTEGFQGFLQISEKSSKIVRREYFAYPFSVGFEIYVIIKRN